jgi:hypothetical protein
MIETSSRPLSRDDRDEIAAVAAAATRRNRPVHYVVAAGVLLVGALAMAGSALLARGAAATALDRATHENAQAKYLIERIVELRDERSGQGAGTPGASEPVTDMLQQLSGLASQAGISVSAPSEQSVVVQGTPFNRKTWAYSFTAREIDNVFSWVRTVGERIPGTTVYSISLAPNAAGRSWNVQLTFARLERTGR